MIPTPRPVVMAVWLSAAVLTAAQSPVTSPQVRIVSPGVGAYVSGPTRLKAIVEPARGVRTVVFFVDGRQICSLSLPPFECDWDAGRLVVEHRVSVSVVLESGDRLSAFVRTRGTGYAEAVDVRVVQVTAAVTDGGKFVHGLPASAFHITEEGVPQKMTSFSDSTSPLDLIVAVDVSASMAPAMRQLKAAVTAFLVAVPSKDRVTLLAFNDRIAPLVERATDAAERAAAVESLSASGETALYDVIVTAIDRLGTALGRKAIVVFSDGEDQGSHATLGTVERQLQASDATLYMIGQGRGTKQQNLKQIMERLANPTGGRAVFTEKIDQLDGIFKELLEELSNQYLLGYPPINEKQDGTWRRIKVHVDGPYKVRARQGYRAGAGR